MNTENNKIIAEFLHGKGAVHPNQYHENWNELMEVIEKIESLGYFFNSAPFINDETGKLSGEHFCIIQYKTTNLNTDYFIDVTGCSTKIEAVYNACLEFIKWHNLNKE